MGKLNKSCICPLLRHSIGGHWGGMRLHGEPETEADIDSMDPVHERSYTQENQDEL